MFILIITQVTAGFFFPLMSLYISSPKLIFPVSSYVFSLSVHLQPLKSLFAFYVLHINHCSFVFDLSDLCKDMQMLSTMNNPCSL